MSSTTTANVTEEMRASLLQRLRAAHRLFELATDDLTLEHVNHFERKGVLPIAFSIAHAVISEDRSVSRLLGVPMLWDQHTDRVRLSGGVPFRGTPMSEAEKMRIGDMEAWRAYQRGVHSRTEEVIAAAPLTRLSETYPTKLEGAAFLALLVGDRDVRVIDALEAWVFQHAIRHVGELEHARALVGLTGVA